jgi:excinuclease ABC subunit C
MNQALETKLKNLPDSPGIYQFINEKGKVIYVGKARNLKNRVRTYFQTPLNSPKTSALVSKITNFELIVTNNEIEALVLENNLIKKFKPRYNVNLKDDKSFPFIKVTNEPFPRVYPTRRLIRDGSKYFGPYTSVKDMKSALRLISQTFRIRTCKLDITKEAVENKKFKVCLEYHIKRCDGPCEGLISQLNYNEMVGEVVKVLKGKTDDLIDDLKTKMKEMTENLEFEKAADIRDKIIQLQMFSSKQKVVTDDFTDRDILTIAHEGKDASCSVLNIRNGKLVGKKQLRLSIELDNELSDIYNSAIKFYYNELTDMPDEIVVEIDPSDKETLENWLNSRGDKKVKFFVPQRGNLRSLVKMSKENSLLQLKEIQLQKMKNQGQISYSVSALQRDLRLKTLPRKIECFDISNLQGTDSVASMVVFENGKPKKSLYRKFIIKDVIGPDDFSSMQEVIKRRYSKVVEGEEHLPDLIMVDGGKGQLSSAVHVLNELNIKNYNIIGLAKRLEEVYFPGDPYPANIPKTSSGLKLLQQVRDEAHRFAITFHRKRRSKRTFQTELTEIQGIGEQTAKLLLKNIGSIEEIKKTDKEKVIDLIGNHKAQLLFDYFENKKTAK